MAEPRRIAVVAPAGVPDPAALAAGIALLRTWGHQVVPGAQLHRVHRYNAGTPAQRASDLLWALQDPAIDLVWLARGGFGLHHLLPALDGVALTDKTVIGCSDATALLMALWRRGHRRLVHGPVLADLAGTVDDRTRQAMRALLAGEAFAGQLVGRAPAGPAPSIDGPLLGGNLTVLASLCGTPWALRGEGAILLLEDITEHAYRLDRCVQQLRLSGALHGVQAVVLGEFVRCHLPPGATYSLSDLLAECLAPLPVLQDTGFGHGTRQQPWPFGGRARWHGTQLVFDAGTGW